jgi:vacuolar-type H+-ATPase subunit I/STV1
MIDKIISAVVALCLCSSLALAQELSSPPSPSRPSSTNISQSIDPTENVKALSEAANKRQDDLRIANERLVESKIAGLAALTQLSIDGSTRERDAEFRRIDNEAKLRSSYEDQLRAAEAKRIDAIRLVDVGAAATLAQRTTEQATALATVVTQSAEVLRNGVTKAAEETRSLVATTAATALQNQQQQFQGITTRLAALEQAGAEGKGKQTISDPAFLDLLKEVKSLSLARTNVTGVETGRNDVIGWIAAGMMFLFAAGGFFYTITRPKLR